MQRIEYRLEQAKGWLSRSMVCKRGVLVRTVVEWEQGYK